MRGEAKQASDIHQYTFSNAKLHFSTRLISKHKAKLPRAARNFSFTWLRLDDRGRYPQKLVPTQSGQLRIFSKISLNLYKRSKIIYLSKFIPKSTVVSNLQNQSVTDKQTDRTTTTTSCTCMLRVNNNNNIPRISKVCTSELSIAANSFLMSTGFPVAGEISLLRRTKWLEDK